MVDHRYKTYVEGIYAQTDNVIAFSIMVGDALFDHAKALRQKLQKRFHIDGPPLHKLDFSRFKEFLPPPEEFKNFANMFDAERHPLAVKPRLHQRLWRKLRHHSAA
jgi:hypothetical protein